MRCTLGRESCPAVNEGRCCIKMIVTKYVISCWGVIGVTVMTILRGLPPPHPRWPAGPRGGGGHHRPAKNRPVVRNPRARPYGLAVGIQSYAYNFVSLTQQVGLRGSQVSDYTDY